MVFYLERVGMLLAAAACATGAGAQEKMFDFSAFGTAGFAITDTNAAQFVRESQPVGADNSGDFGLDSRLGVQGTAHLMPQISATVQVMFRRQYQTSMELDVPLAFVKDQLTSDFAVRLGRLQFPAFLVSEYRQVGYANTMLRPPQEVYGQVPLDAFNGADAQYAHTFGPVEINAQAIYGNVNYSGINYTVAVRKMSGGNLTATWGPVTLRYGRVMDHLTVTSAADPLIAGVAAAGFTDLATRLASDNKPSSFTGFGLSVDWHNVLLMAESTAGNGSSYLPDTRGRYAMLGYRIQKVTPYASYQVRTVTSPRSDSTIPQVGPLIPLALGVNAVLSGAQQHSESFGIRWDFHDSIDLKVQFDHVSPEGAGLFQNVKPGFSGPVWVGALAVDFVL
jgi:hypothetical protein